jgi:glycosyltransferase involved in cell wall biosynthesis
MPSSASFSSVIIVTPHFLPGGGGQEVTVNRLAEVFSLKGEKVKVLCFSKKGYRDQEKKFDDLAKFPIVRINPFIVRLLRLKASFLKTKFLIIANGFSSFFCFFYLVFREIWQNKQSKIILFGHALMPILGSIFCRKIFFKKSFQIVFFNHYIYQRTGFKLADILSRYVLQSIDHSFCLSVAAKNKLISDFKVSPNKITIQRIGIALQELPVDKEEILKFKKMNQCGQLKILFTGRIVPEKGVAEIIELARYIHRQNLTHKYLITIIGDSDHPLQNDVINASAVLSSLQYLGRVEKPRLWEYYKEHDLFLFPSQWAEAAGNVILEAYAFGLPVIGSATGGIPEYLQYFKYHRLLQNFSPEEFLRAIDELGEILRVNGVEAILKEAHLTLEKYFSLKNFEDVLKVIRN